MIRRSTNFFCFVTLFSFVLYINSVHSVNPGCFPNCLAEKPPLGWRSWNAFADVITQPMIKAQIDGLTLRRNSISTGKPSPYKLSLPHLESVLASSNAPSSHTTNLHLESAISLYDLGFQRIGIDDGWQACGEGVNGSFHNADGHYMYNFTRFPNMTDLVLYARSKGVAMDAYHNNDGCCEYGHIGPEYTNDANDLVNEGFTGSKFDNCGPGRNITQWAVALNATGVEVLIENCNDNTPFRPTINPDGSLDCPYNFYRTGSDNSPSWYTIAANLVQINDFLNISQPRCWAYSDLLEVGAPAPFIQTHCNNSQRLTYEQAQGHFGAWAVVSSPLILGFDMSNMTEYDMWWPIVSNTEVIAVNQLYNGEAGHLVAQSTGTYTGPVSMGCLCEATRPSFTLPEWSVWGKSLPNNQFAAIALNTLLDTNANFTITTEQLGFPAGATLHVRDLFAHEDLPTITGTWNVNLGPSGSQLLLFTP